MKKRTKIALAVALGILIALAAWIRLGALPDGFLDRTQFVSTRILDRRGVVLYETLSPGGTRGDWLEADALPDTLVSATLAAEDHRFFRHPGVDPFAYARATLHNLAAMRVVEGGSTITQQVVKQILIARGESRRRGIAGKLRETLLALRLEHRYSKREILALYLNLAPYGNQFIGARRASLGYFGREPASLTLAESAFLAGLPQRPSGYDPYRHPKSANTRQKSVLARIEKLDLVELDAITDAKHEELRLVRERPELVAPHFVTHVLRGAASARTIETTLDAELQRKVQGIIRAQRTNLEKHGAHNVAVAVLDNHTGEWLVWEGSGDYFDTVHGGAIDGVVTARQPGSALKPFTYALAFESGFTPASVLADVPSHFPTREEGVLYSPRNYDGKFHGPLLARRALGGSQNVPAVALASQIGVPSIGRLLRRAGMSTFDKTADHYGLGLTLGNAEVRLDELVAAYASFARGGELVRTTMLARSRTNGIAPPAPRLVSQQTAYWITDILSDQDARAWVFGRGSSLDFPFPVAVKTGTSQAYHDNWTVGYTGAVTVGVWVGNFDRAPLRNSSGVTGAAPIFRAVMLSALESVAGRLPDESDPPIVARPASLVRSDICSLSGLIATERCPGSRLEWLPPGEPGRQCYWHHVEDGETIVEWPPEYLAWARATRVDAPRRGAANSTVAVSSVHELPRSRARSRGALVITNPPHGATYLIEPTLRPEFQSLSLRVAHGGEPREIDWSVDGAPLGKVRSDRSLSWPLRPGEHRFVASDGKVRREAVIVVR
ncbi:MAG: penicillin-binding protein 1C [Acidobacteria bacterium]|nr:penicillin-binding protein 1C [Acidobacteriota bacterium]